MSAGDRLGLGFLSKSAAIGADEEEQRKVLAALPYYERAIKSGLPFPKTRRVVFLKNNPRPCRGGWNFKSPDRWNPEPAGTVRDYDVY